MIGRPPWTKKWGEDGFRYQVLTTRARAILAAAFAGKRYISHPWLEYDWEPVLEAVNRVLSLFLQAKSISVEPNGSVPILPALKIAGEYKEIRERAVSRFSFSRLFQNDEWRAQTRNSLDSRQKPKKSFVVPIVEWRKGIEADEHSRIEINLYASGESHQPPVEVWEFLETELTAQLNMPIYLHNSIPRDDIDRVFGLTSEERLWDLRIRFTDFLRRFLTCYRPDLDQHAPVKPDPFTVFFVQPRTHRASVDSVHLRSGLFGHAYVIDAGQQRFLVEQKGQQHEHSTLPTDAIQTDYLPFPDGLCTHVYLTARSSDSVQVGRIIAGYAATGHNAQLKRLEASLLQNRTLMEIPIYDELPMLGDPTADGPRLTLCIAVPMPFKERAEETDKWNAIEYFDSLRAPDHSNYAPGEAQIVREMALKMARRFLSVSVASDFSEVVGVSPVMLNVKRELERLSSDDSSILILGESGTGKSRLARAIHAAGTRVSKPFENVDSAPDELFYEHLFGCVKGAHSTALENKDGIAKLADGGTLLIDDIDRLSLKAQEKFLGFLDNKSFRPSGSTKEIKVDVRVIATTNASIPDMIDAGTFRRDLYFRLKKHVIILPPLRERREDIPLWAEKFLEEICRKTGRRAALTSSAVEVLTNHNWPENLRELETVLERANQDATGGEIRAEHLKLESNDEGQENNVTPTSSSSDITAVLMNLPGTGIEEKLRTARLILEAGSNRRHL